MARIRIPCLVAKTSKHLGTSWYWQPSKTLKAAGWQPLSLGKDEGAAIAAARARNEEVERWKAGGLKPVAIQPRRETGTLSALIAHYEKHVLEGKHPDGRPLIAPTTAKVYRTSLRRLEKWAGKHPVAFVTMQRVRALRDAMLAPAERGGIGHHAAHQTLKMGRTLFRHALYYGLAADNPFKDFRLAAPPPRDVIWSTAAREAMVAAAHAAAMPSVALAVQLGYAIAQREADVLGLTIGKWVAIPQHKVQPEDWRTLTAMAPDGVPRAFRIRQRKTGQWVEVPVTGTVRAAVEAAIARARAAGSTAIIRDDTRGQLYAGTAGQTRFQRDFALIRAAAVEAATKASEPELAAELASIEYRDLRRTCVVYLGELGLDAHQIAAITGHDLDETLRILKTYMPRTTGLAARAVAVASIREAAEAKRTKKEARA